MPRMAGEARGGAASPRSARFCQTFPVRAPARPGALSPRCSARPAGREAAPVERLPGSLFPRRGKSRAVPAPPLPFRFRFPARLAPAPRKSPRHAGTRLPGFGVQPARVATPEPARLAPGAAAAAAAAGGRWRRWRSPPRARLRYPGLGWAGVGIGALQPTEGNLRASLSERGPGGHSTGRAG